MIKSELEASKHDIMNQFSLVIILALLLFGNPVFDLTLDRVASLAEGYLRGGSPPPPKLFQTFVDLLLTFSSQVPLKMFMNINNSNKRQSKELFSFNLTIQKQKIVTRLKRAIHELG